MHTFFHGWRRKAGLVSLVMALAMFGLWMRSMVHYDFFASIAAITKSRSPRDAEGSLSSW
jgi:hypothetical protein